MTTHTPLLTQNLFMFRKVVLSVENNTTLAIREKTLTSSTRVSIDLDQIDPSPNHIREISPKWISYTVISLFATIFCIYAAIKDGNPGLWVIAAIFLATALTCTRNLFLTTINSLFFYSASTGAHIFSIAKGKPSDEEVERFVKLLEECIKQFRTPRRLSLQDQQDLYKRHLNYLLKEGVLSQEEHDSAVDRLESKTSSQNVVSIVR